MQRLKIICGLLFMLTRAFSQTMEFGKDASYIKQMAQYIAESRTGYDSYGNSKGNNVSWDVKYFDGHIDDVIICYDNQYLLDWRIHANFCKHYLMENGKLASIVSQYENVSTAQLLSFYSNNSDYIKSGDLFYSKDLKNVSKIYLSKNGQAFIEYKPVSDNKLPADLKEIIAARKKSETEEYNRKIAAEHEFEQKKKDLQSKTYDLQKLKDDSQYGKLLRQQSEKIIETLENYSGIPSYSELANSTDTFAFNNSYYIHYNMKGEKYGEFKLLSGRDTSCDFIKRCSVPISTVFIDGIEVKTEATINKVIITFTRGVVKVKVKRGKLIYKDYTPSPAIQLQIKEKLANQDNGICKVYYEFGNVMGNPFYDVRVIDGKVKSSGSSSTKKKGKGFLWLGLLSLGAGWAYFSHH